MKAHFRVLMAGLLSLAMLLAACSPTAPAAETDSQATLKVLASTTFLADIARNVAGERAVVESLLPVGADPHSYQAAPTDVAKIADSDVLILNGLEYEHFIEPLLENAGGERLVIEATQGLEVLQMGEHEGDGEDHSPEAHAGEICEQLEGQVAAEVVEAGAGAAAAVEMHGEEHAAGDEHAHEREIINLKLHAQPDGTYAGYLLFEADLEQGYAFTAPAGSLSVTDAAGAALEAAQTLAIDCSGMTVGNLYSLPAGEYIVALTGFGSETIPFSAAPMHAHEHEAEADHVHEAGDPHMWLDPIRVMTYVENIRAGLSEADPAGVATYQANAEAYSAQLKDLDQWIAEQVNAIPAERRLLVTNHEALGYFAARYGFQVVGAVIPSLSTEASPSAQQMAALVEQIATANAPAIFLGEVENPNLARQIAEETGVKVIEGLYLETLTEGAPAATYLEMMKHNVTLIVAALK